MRRLLTICAALAIGGCGADEKGGASSGGLPGPEGNDNLYPVGSLATTGGALYQDVVSVDGRVFACTGTAGLRIADRGSDGALTPAADVTFPDGRGCSSVARSPLGVVFAAGQATGGGAFVATLGADGAVASSVVLEGLQVESLVATDSHVIALVGQSGIVVMGQNDGALAEVARLAAGFDQALGGAVWGDSRLVVANGLEGLVVVDLSDPTAPSVERTIRTFGTARRLVVEGDRAVVATAAGGVNAIDLMAANPYPPQAAWSTHGTSVDVALGPDGLVYVANLGDLCILDASDPGALTLLGAERVASESINSRVVAVDADDFVGVAAEWGAVWSYAFAPGLGAPDVHVSKTSVDFGLVSLSKGKGLIVSNLGVEALKLETPTVVDADGAVNEEFTVEIERKTLAPGDQMLMEIGFSPSSDEAVEAWVEMGTNDPDEPVLRVPLVANKNDGYQVGVVYDPDAEAVFTEYQTGNQVTVKDQYAGKVVLLVWFASW